MDSFRSGQYLTLRVGGQDFAIDAGCIRGVLPTHELVSSDPDNSPWIIGSAVLRGHVFPVINLRAKLGLKYGIEGRNPSIVVVDTGAGLAGFLAERVSEVIFARAHDFRGGKIRVGRPRVILDPRSLVAEPAIL